MDPTAVCCPVVAEALTPEEAVDLATLFKVLADPVRLRLLSLIASVPEGETCACDLTDPLERSQATVSHHLTVLAEAGLITRQQRGRWAWFRIAPNKGELVQAVLGGRPELALTN